MNDRKARKQMQQKKTRKNSSLIKSMAGLNKLWARGKQLFSILLLAMPLRVPAQDTNFVCPIKKGKIIIEERRFVHGKTNPGAVFEGKNNKVYSCSSGFVEAIDSSADQIRVYIVFQNYSFSYNRIGSLCVKEGQSINKGDQIGELVKGERLFLICRKNKILIEPKDILRCKVFTRQLD